MRLHLRTGESTSGVWVFKEARYDLYFMLELTPEELSTYDKMSKEIAIPATEYTRDRTHAELGIRSSELYSLYDLVNPTVGHVVDHARKKSELGYSFRSRSELEYFQSTLEKGIGYLSSKIKEAAVSSASQNKTIDY